MQERTQALVLSDNASVIGEITELCPERYFNIIVHSDHKTLETCFADVSPDICFIDGTWANDDLGPLCRMLQAFTPQKGLPTILVQHDNNLSQRVSGFESGLTDALQQPLSKDEFRARIALQLRVAKLEFEQTQIIDKLWHARQSAEESAKKKGRFLENLCNQLVNEINTIRSFAETHTSTERADVDRSRDRVLHKTSSVLELLLDTLDLTTLDVNGGGFIQEEVFLRELVQSLAVEFSLPCSEKGLRFTCSVSEGVPDIILSDQLRLRQVMHNLIDNAIKYTDEGSVRVEIRKGVVRKGEDPLRLYFEVKDSGKGIPKSLIPHITDPFGKSGALKLAGTGVGLALTSKILSLMDSKLHFDSTPNAGTTVSFSIVPIQAHEISTDSEVSIGSGIQSVFAVVYAASQLDLQNTRRRLVQTGCTVFGYRPEDLQTISETVFVPDIVFVDPTIEANDVMKLIRAFGDQQSAQALWIVSTPEQFEVLPVSFASRLEPALSTKHLYKILSAVAPADVAESQMLAASISIAQVARWVSEQPAETKSQLQENIDFLRHAQLESLLASMEDGAERNTLLMNVMGSNTQYLLQLGSYIETVGVE